MIDETTEEKRPSVSEAKKVPSKFQKALDMLGFVSGIVILLGLIVLTYNGKLRLLSPRDPVHLATFSSKIEFTARYWILPLVWLYVSMHLVVLKRISSKAQNPLSGNEALVASSVNIFTNSIEQFLMSLAAQLTLITFIESEKIIRLIPLINIAYVVGRILFWIGYPKYRTLGMTVTMLPTSLAIYLSLYRFVFYWIDFHYLIDF